MQGKLFQKCTHFLYYSVLSLGGEVNTRRPAQPDMESIFTKIINEMFWSKETIVWIIKIKYFVPPRILDEHWCIYSCLQIPPRENWFQYLRRVYTTAINFPCISTLVTAIFPWRITWNYAYSPSLNIVNYFSYLLLVRPGRLDINGSVRTKKWYSIFKLKDSSNMSI